LVTLPLDYISFHRGYASCVDYCYINPVKHGLANAVVEWPYSSFHRDVEHGVYPSDWAGVLQSEVDFGEP
jgi:putative transposase